MGSGTALPCIPGYCHWPPKPFAGANKRGCDRGCAGSPKPRGPCVPGVNARVRARRSNRSMDAKPGVCPLTIDAFKSRRKARLDALPVALPGASGRTINGVDAYFTTDRRKTEGSQDRSRRRLPSRRCTACLRLPLREKRAQSCGAGIALAPTRAYCPALCPALFVGIPGGFPQPGHGDGETFATGC